jgi:hypothetical protein
MIPGRPTREPLGCRDSILPSAWSNVGAVILVTPVLLASFSYTQYGWPGVTWTLGMGYIVIVMAILQRVGVQRWK